LDTDQSLALLNSDAPLGFQVSLQNYYDLKRIIVEHCNGLIGALCKSVAFYGEQACHFLPTQVECLHLFYSKKFLDHMDRCFGFVANSQLHPESKDVLLKCVLGEDINRNTNARFEEVLLSFVKAGILVSDKVNLKFASPLAKKYFTNCYFTNPASSNPTDLYQLEKQPLRVFLPWLSNYQLQVQVISLKKPRFSICSCLDYCPLQRTIQQFALSCQDLFKLELM
jgi:hypothetical protein